MIKTLFCFTLLLTTSTLQAHHSTCYQVRLGQLPHTPSVIKTTYIKLLLELIGYQVTLTERDNSLDILRALEQNAVDIDLDMILPLGEEAIRGQLDSGRVRVIAKNIQQINIHLYANSNAKSLVKDVSDLPNIDPSQLNNANQTGETTYTIYYPHTRNEALPALHHLLDSSSHAHPRILPFPYTNPEEFAQSDVVKEGVAFFLFSDKYTHPDLTRLTDKKAVLGNHKGEHAQYTLARTHFIADCPNYARILSRIDYPMKQLREIIQADDIQTNGMQTDEKHYSEQLLRLLKSHPEVLTNTFKGMKTKDGQPALPVAKANLEKRIASIP